MQLRAIRGRDAGRVVVLRGTLTLGRTDENDVQLLDDTASRRHTEFTVDERGVRVRDLGSSNGTLVNGARVDSAYLADGDEICVGNTLFVFEAREDDGRDTEAPRARATSLNVKSALRRGDADPFARHGGEDASAYESRLRTLFDFDSRVCDALELSDVAQKLFAVLKDAVPFHRGLFEVYDDDGHVLYEAQSTAGPARGEEVVVSRTVVKHALSRQESLLLEDAGADDRFAGRRSVVREGITSALCVPLIHDRARLGVIYLDLVGGQETFGEADLLRLTHLAERVAPRVAAALRFSQTRQEVEELRSLSLARAEIAGESPAIRDLLEIIARAAPTDAAVLIRGETGVGKELVARRLHDLSARERRPFVAVNCAAIPAGLMEAELFGAERGAYTGASRLRRGKFETARGGTLFLDEVGDLPLDLQPKLLRVLQDGEFYRVGGEQPLRAEARVIAATNRDLKADVAEGGFREDLLFRLAVIVVDVPPLRAREGDVELLAERFLFEFAAKMNRRGARFTEGALEAMARFPWPGNVRELRNAVERALIVSEGERIGAEHLPAEIAGKAGGAAGDADLYRALSRGPISLAEAERICIIMALRATGGKKGEAARILGVSWPTLNKKIADYGI
ncbi:MAG: sigma 54-interacting transcriptional regulator [Planctomycetes bacterium]|nr:sigma 54-interacting transcriptional regulator [Planctomycetota bacterium]